jgi:hypothetical protein
MMIFGAAALGITSEGLMSGMADLISFIPNILVSIKVQDFPLSLEMAMRLDDRAASAIKEVRVVVCAITD